ncbi:5'/3'-nucleotidase SurE [uncultured Megasphaera sp.]|uniref:5'/3'-nucleotidase SurE n=1 Tax=uncultured Megasphaera sp. TaxID=165188 RepID=UPI002659238D|nr:5'/3'-nucleotidase SurE [uncultured Megasphaera sp.]
MHILLTNDDGLRAPGLQLLKNVMAHHGYDLTVVAPNGQRSAASHSMTINRSLYCQERQDGTVREIAVSGTPVDCVKLAMEYFLQDCRPDLILSGINDGYNLGSDVLYSGTVSAAMEGPYYQVPAIAASMCPLTEERCRQTANLLHELIQRVIVKGRFPGILNVNVPPQGEISLDNIRVVPQTVQIYHNVIAEHKDIDDSVCYRIVGDIDMKHAPAYSDVAAVRDGHIAVTPLKWQQTATAVMDEVKQYL